MRRTKTWQLRLSEEEALTLKLLARAKSITISELVRWLVQRELENELPPL